MNERPAKFSHFQLARRGENYTLKMASLDSYQAEGRHSGNAIKDRSEFTFPWVRVYHSKTRLDYSFQIDRTTTVSVSG